MTLFWIGAAVLVVLAWLMVLPALRSRPAAVAERGTTALDILKDQLATLDREHAAGTLDAAQHSLSRQEIERRILDESLAVERPARSPAPRKTLALVGLAVPLFAIGIYVAIGNLAGLAPQPAAQARDGADVSPEQIESMLIKLSERLEKSTGNATQDLQGWTMLGRSYAALQRFPEADHAYVRALALAPTDPQLLADRADVLAMVQGQSLKGEPDRLVAQALQIDPRNLKALALAGASAFERKDFAAARSYWQRAKEIAPAGSEFAAGLDRSLSEIGGGSAPSTTVVAASPAASATASAAASEGVTAPARITGKVSLSPALAARALPTDTVFIFARAAEGPRMPLAILKRSVADLPITFTLDDSMAMSPAMKLSNFPRVVVGARISRSGNAMPQPGDLRGESVPVGTGANDLQLVIDGVQP